MSNAKKEAEHEDCPPGMRFDADTEKCVSTDNIKTEDEDNAGMTTDKGEPTLTDASTKDNPADTHDCAEGFTWDGEQCVPTGGGDAGTGGGAGTGDPDTPGKERLNEKFYKMIERLMASHSSYNATLLEDFKKSNTENLHALLASNGKPIYKAESAAYGIRMESISATTAGSSMVNDKARNDVYDNTVKNPANWFEAAAHKGGNLTDGYTSWTINPQAYYESLRKGWMNYTMTHSEHGKLEGTSNATGEAFTITVGDMPQIFSKQVYLVPV